MEITLHEDGNVAAHISPALFGLGGDVSAANRAVEEAVANLFSVGVAGREDGQAIPPEFRDLDEYMSSTRAAMVSKLGELDDYVASLRSRIDAARRKL